MLLEPEPSAKVARARQVATAWFDGQLLHAFSAAPPDRPARPDKPELLAPTEMPRRKRKGRRKGGSAQTRKALLHAIAHIEFNAIDLAFDMVARFGNQMPREFTDDWVRVGDDEARHFEMVTARLAELDACYGDLPAHNGLWEAAMETAGDVAARLAIVPMVLEARGLDVTPGMINQFHKQEDEKSANLLQVILDDEVTHVHAGVKWFEYMAEKSNKKPFDYFNLLVKRHFRGGLKPPFNDSARQLAHMNRDYYQPAVDC